MQEMTTPWLIYLGLVLLGLIVIEAIGFKKYGPAGTLSDHVRYWNRLHPAVGFILGVTVGILMWHWFVSVNPQ